MAERNQDDWGPLASSYTAPPSVRPNAPSSKSPSSQVPYYMEPIIGFKNELAGAIQIAKNITGVIENAASKLSEKTGQDYRVSFEEIRGAMEEAQQSLVEDVPGTEGSPARALLRGVGAAPVQFLEYGIPALLTKRPTAVFALVDAAREADKGWAAAGKAAAIGAAGGFAQGQIAKIPSLLARSGAGALVGGAQAKLQGGAPEDIVASALMGGGFSALAHEKIPDVRRGPDGQPLAFTVREPKPEVKPGVSWFESPHLKFEHVPGAAEVVTDAIDAAAKIDARAERWNLKAREAFRGKGIKGIGALTSGERQQLVEYLNDPQYTIANPPPGPAKMREAFVKAREVTEEARTEILKLKREQWVNERAEPPEAVWAQERQRLGRALTPQEAEAFRAQRRAGLEQTAQTAIPDFGREGYFPHTFEGPWKTVFIDQQGQEKPIEIGGWLSETRRDAEIKAEQYALSSGLPRNRIVVAEYDPNIIGAEHNRTTGKRFFGNVEQRKADLTGWVNDEDALFKYLNNTARYLEMSRLRPKLQGVRSWIETNMPDSSTLRQWRNYEDRVEGRPDTITRAVNDAVVKAGFRPDVVQRATGFIRSAESLAKLGFSPASALTNTSQYWLNCVDEETEALTPSGWKKHNQLTPGEMILCYDIETDTTRWDVLQELHKGWHDGQLFTLEGRHISARTTTGHRWPVEKKSDRTRTCVVNELRLPKGQGSGIKRGRLSRDHVLILARKCDNLPKESAWPDWFVSLCGWIASEGSFHTDSRKHRGSYGNFRYITISQSETVNPEKAQCIRSLLAESGMKFVERKGSNGVVEWRLSAHDSRRFLYALPKKCPTLSFVCSLTEHQLGLFTKAMIAGDGSWSENPLNRTAVFFNTDLANCEAVQVAFALLGTNVKIRPAVQNGNRSSKPIYRTQINIGRLGRVATVARSAKSPTEYSGVVWCPSVATTFWVARRNGMIHCTGNSVPVLGRYAWNGFKGATETFTASVLRKHGMGAIVPKGIKDYSWLLDELNIGSEAHKGDVLSQADRFRLYLPKNEKERPQYWLNAINHFGLWMFSNAEYLNRAATVIGAYEKGIARGLSKQQAIRKAREVEVRTQFTYGAADAPMVLNNPWTKTAFQFQNYFLKQMEFMLGTAFGKSQYGRFDTRRQELGRMLGATLMATGAVGLPGIETLDALIDGATGYSFLDELNKSESPLLRNASRGLPGLIGQINPKLSGIDLSRSIGYGDFFSTSKLIPKFGPAVNEAILLLGAVAADPGLETDTKVKDLLSKISPQGRRIVESFMKDSAQNGQVLDAKGRLVMKDLKPFEEWAMKFGFSPVGITEERERYMRDQELVRRAQSKRGGYIQVISDAIKRGDSEYAERMASEAAAAGYPGLWGAAMKQARTPTQTRSELYQRRFRRSLRTPPPAAGPAAAPPAAAPGVERSSSAAQWGDW